MRYSIKPKDRIYVKCYQSFAKGIRECLSSRYGQKLLGSTKN